ncbi:MAG: hypothetical protein ACT4OP_04180 [Actinomycetota bacterium]
MEPVRRWRRLSRMRRMVLLAAVSLLTLAAIPLAQAQVAQAQPPVRMEAKVGLAGYVQIQRPVEVAVTIEADVLFAGWLEARTGDTVVRVAVEVPAGGAKTYDLRLPPPVGSVSTRLRLFDRNGSGRDGSGPLATTNLQLRTVDGETLVAVVGRDELVKTIDSAEVAVTGDPVVAAAIDLARLETGVEPANYLVLDQPGELPEPVVLWLDRGGRLVIDRQDSGSLGLAFGRVIPDGERSLLSYGQGWVIAVPDIGALDVVGWSQVLVPTPIQLAPRDVWQSPELQLMQSATSGGDQRVPSLPWLLGALVGYAILVGPVNFLILRRLGRRELAWVTVPALSLLAVVGFWLAGRQRLEETIINHASLVISAPDRSEGRTALVLATGSGGERTVAVPADWEAYPASVTIDGGMPVASALAESVAPGEFRFTLEQLGSAGVQSWWQSAAFDLPQVLPSASDNRLKIDVNNQTPHEFWAWGLVGRGRVTVAPQALAPGEAGGVSVLPGQSGANEFGSVGDAVINSRNLWNDPFIWNKLGALSYAASSLLAQYDSYFFGYTDQMSVSVIVDGREVKAPGSTLVLIPVDAGAIFGSQAGSVTAHLISTGDASWVDIGPGYLSVSTQQMTIGWEVPQDIATDPTLAVSNMFGEIPRVLEAYNWDADAYEEVLGGQSLDLGLYRSPVGQVLVRASAGDGDVEGQFIEQAMSPYGFSLVWP